MLSRREFLPGISEENMPDFDFDFLLSQKPLAIEGDNADVTAEEDSPVDINGITFEFDSNISKADRLDYIVATSVGALTAAIDIFFVGDIDLGDAHSNGAKQAETFVIGAAKKFAGYKGETLEGAITALEKKFPLPADSAMNKFGGSMQHHLRDFTHHPSIVGLCASLISQITGVAVGTDTDGEISFAEIRDDLRGKNIAEQIAMGTWNWIMHLVSDMAGSSDSARMGKEGTGIPGPVMSLIKEFSALSFAEKLEVEHNGKEIPLSEWASKLFNGTLLAEHDENGRIIKGTEKKFDLRTEMGISDNILKSAIPVIINEAIVRTFYMVRKLYEIIKSQKISRISDLLKIDPADYLPLNNRQLNRMIFVSTGTFMVIVTAKDGATALAKGKGNIYMSAAYLVVNINWYGVARFYIACRNDAPYLKEDIKEAYREFVEGKKKEAEAKNRSIPGLESLTLNEKHTRILYSLKWQKIMHDIICTDNDKAREKKKDWLKVWEKRIADGFMENCELFFIKSEEELYMQIKEECLKNECNNWLYVVLIEVSSFEPYFKIEDSKDRGIRYSQEYELEVFAVKQNTISLEKIKEIKKQYRKYESIVNGKRRRQLIGAGTAAVVTAASGGLAFAFAPQIAVVLAGGSFAGLSGAALTSASLAAIGGGSLAAGGLGMTGGAAIIAGGGAILGITGSGTIAVSASMMLSSEENTVKECSKLLTYCSSTGQNKSSIREYDNAVYQCIEEVQKMIDEKKGSEDKDAVIEAKALKHNLKYVKRCKELLTKICRDENSKEM